MAFTVLVTDYAWPTLDVEAGVLGEVGARLVAAETGEEPELVRLSPAADAILTCWKRVGPAVLDAAPRCRIVSRYGVGLDNIAVDRATELGIVVTNVPDYCAEEVSDHAMALLLACARRVVTFAAATRRGSWDAKAGRPIPRLRGQTLGLIGFGRNARALAPKAAGFGLRILAYDPFVPASDVLPYGTMAPDLETLLRESDYVSLHAPLTTETRGLLDARTLRLMKRTAYLINTARGPIVDEAALYEALTEGWIAGAGLDVLSQEPPDPASRLLALGNVIATPHAAFYSETSIQELARKAAERVAAALRGELPPCIVNPAVLERPDHRMATAGPAARRAAAVSGQRRTAMAHGSEWTPDPDFRRLRTALLRQGEPDRVPLHDSVDVFLKKRFLGLESLALQRTGSGMQTSMRLPLELEIEFAYRAGYDFVPLGASMHTRISGTSTTLAAKYAAFGDEHQERGWANEGAGIITTREAFDGFPWPDPEETDTTAFEQIGPKLPSGMKVLVDHGKVFTGVWWLMGLDVFCRAVKKDPALVARMYEKVGAAQYRILDIVTDFECVGGVRFADDLAYAQGLMVAPAHLREHFFPWLKACVDLVHRKGKVFIFHSDGDVRLVLEDIIAAGVDGLHPIEPKAMDIVELKARVGSRITLCGNIDLGYTLTRGTPEEVEAEVKERLRRIAPGGGYVLGSSNSVPEYVPLENFNAMREACLRYGRYPIALD